jgi:hypothetical protein
MDTLLLLITLAALTTAIVSATWLLRVLADERRRSDARVEALRQQVGADGLSALSNVDGEAPAAAGQSEMFAGTAASSTRSRSWIIAAAAAAAVVIVVAVSVLGGGAGESVGASAGQASSTSGRLELISLRHTQDQGTLTITGHVQNPGGASALSHVSAMVHVFGIDGSVVATGRAPLDLTSLGPGEESPFVIAVPVNGSVSRYRIGFRDAEGRVVEHLDRRPGVTIATK